MSETLSMDDAQAAGNRPRKPWLALLLAFVSTPVAFAYVGRYAWAIGLTLLELGLFALVGWTGWLQSVVGFWITAAFCIPLIVASIVLPWVFARTQRNVYRLRWYNHWYGYLLLLVVISVPMTYLITSRARYFGFDNFRTPSGSMEPTISRGDYIVADTRPQTLASLQEGDIVVHESAANPDVLYLRRIVAMHGQHIVVDDEGVHVDGKLETRTHQQGSDVLPERWMRFADVQLEEGQVYLMGDNRGNSQDSRAEGPYELEQIRAKATAIWLSPRGNTGDLIGH